MIIQIAQQFFRRLQDKNRLAKTKIDQKRTADRLRSTEIRQVIETANAAAFAKPTARLATNHTKLRERDAHDLLAPEFRLLYFLNSSNS
jgi:hypothetical protein